MAYMIRRKFYIPKSEYFRDYRDGHEKDPSNFILKCDWEEVDDEDSFTA